VSIDVEKLIDPEIAEALAALPRFGPFTFEQLPAMREQRFAQLATVELSDRVERSDYTIPGPEGAPDVTVRVHRAKDAQGALPCVYFMHGGGYVMGTYAMDDLRFDRWCPQLNCVGVSVEYRLSPETAYPGPLEDCYAGLKWVYDHADELGVDRGRLGIGGASAGGGLAAGLGLLARDRAEVPLAFQLLIYPMIDDRMTSASSGWEVPIWPPASNERGWAAYLGPLVGGEVPLYAAAARAAEVAGLPSTYIMVGSLDGFLDEDVDYAMRLTRAGVPTELHVYPGAPHGFDGITPGAAQARRARKHMEEWLERTLR
jgi:acetyl esterase/lipase